MKIIRVLLSEVIDRAKQMDRIKKLEFGVMTTQKEAYQLCLALSLKKVGEEKYVVKVEDEYFDEYLMELYSD